MIAAGLVAIYLTSWFIALKSPLSLEYEGPCLWAAIELARGHNIYDPQRLLSAPWEVTIYTPLYFILGAPFQAGGYNYMALRLLSMISFFATSVFFCKVCRLYTDNRLNIAIGFVTFASCIATWLWAFKARVDMMALALSAAALYFFARGMKQRDEAMATKTGGQALITALRLYWPAILILVAATATKQPSLVVLISVCLVMLIRRWFADLTICALSSLFVLGGLFVMMNALTGGGFGLHMSFASRMPFAISDLAKHLGWVAVDQPKLLMVPIAGVAFWFKGEDKGRLVLPLVLSLISGALTAYTIGTMYANLNHGLIFIFAIAWFTVICLDVYSLSLGSVMLGLSALSSVIMAMQIQPLQTISDRMEKTNAQLAQLKAKGKTIFVEDPALAIACDARPLFIDVATFLQVWARDKRPLTDLEEALAEKRYPVVIINQNDSLGDPPYFWNEAIMKKLNDNYQKMDYVIGNGELQQIYVPK